MRKKEPYKTEKEKKMNAYYMSLLAKPFTVQELMIINKSFKKDAAIIAQENKLYKNKR